MSDSRKELRNVVRFSLGDILLSKNGGKRRMAYSAQSQDLIHQTLNKQAVNRAERTISYSCPQVNESRGIIRHSSWYSCKSKGHEPYPTLSLDKPFDVCDARREESEEGGQGCDGEEADSYVTERSLKRRGYVE